MITVKSFVGEAGIRTLAPAWRALTARLTLRRHFHHIEWYLALAHTLERHNLGQLQCIAVFSDGGELAAVLPCRAGRTQIGPVEIKEIRLASDHIDASTARDFIIAPNLAVTNFFEGFVRYMAEHDSSWDVIQLPGILEDSLAVTALKHTELSILQTPSNWGRIALVSCGSGIDPFACLSKGFRQNLRTSHHKLDPTKVTFEIARTESGLAKLLPEFLKVESSGWKGTLGTSAAKDPVTNTFLLQLIYHFGPTGGCEIRLMRYGDQPIAALFGITTDRIWYIFRIGYDETHHRASPGHLIIENLLRQNVADKLFTTLTPYNAPPWFQAWKPNQTLQIFNVYIFRQSSQGMELAQRILPILQSQRQAG